jgi:16S rRNA (uracil1498-N3)-methyltransferase
MNRFFVNREQILNDEIQILGKDVKHIKDVLRLKTKDNIEIVCEEKTYVCEISDITSNMVKALIIDSFYGKNEPPIHIALYQGVAKGNKMDFIIQKVTEIGVKEIYPVITERTIVKIKDVKKEQNKVERWNAIAEEAAKQSKRDILPIVKNVLKFSEMIDILKHEANIIVPYEMEESYGLKKALEKVNSRKINIIIGPEGGFEEDEIIALKKIKGQVVTLGPRILRTETAGLVTSSIVLYELGDLGVIR